MPKYQVRVCLGKKPQVGERMDGKKVTVKPPECGLVFNLLLPTGGTNCPDCGAASKLLDEYEADAPRPIQANPEVANLLDATMKDYEDASEKTEMAGTPLSEAVSAPPKDRAMKSPKKKKAKKKK